MGQTKPLGSATKLWINAQAWALRRLAALSRAPRTAAHLETGAHGEREALFHLRRNGYIVVARRWRNAKLRGDIDLIAWDRDTLCIVEVKTRTRRDAIPAESAVDSDKQDTLRRLARAYLRRLPLPAREATVRFDVISIYLESQYPESQDAEPSSHPPNTTPHIELNKGAFGWA
jgi:putative endonuclease